MKKIHIWFVAILICLSVICIKSDTYAATAWEKNENGVYVNSEGERIERAALRGIDISKYQQPPYASEIDWNKVAADDVDFVIIRTGYGVVADETLVSSMDACEAVGMPYGVYHYTHAKTEAEAKAEAEFVVSLLQGRKLSYPVYYDIESEGLFEQLSKEQCLKNAKAFCEVIEAAGYKTGIYANMNWYKNKLTDSWFASQNRWIARYISDYTIKWPEMKNFSGMWQCTASGTIDGIEKDVDINFIIESVPAKVNSFKGSNAAYNKHKLTWKAVAGADGYVIQGKKTSGKSYSTIATIKDGAQTSYTVESRTTGTKYNYRIKAYKILNGKKYYSSGYVYAKNVKSSLSKPAVKSVTRKGKKVTIKWDKVAGATSYKIYYKKSKSGKYKLLKTISSGKKTSYTYTLKKGKYYYRIKAYRKVSKKTTVSSSYSSAKKCK